jgi:hypothetical protein
MTLELKGSFVNDGVGGAGLFSPATTKEFTPSCRPRQVSLIPILPMILVDAVLVL